MPYTISLPLQYDDSLLPELHRALHANLYAWFAAADADLAEDMHRRAVRKPFSLSPLMREREKGWSLHVALLEDALWEPFWAGLQARPFADLLGRHVPLALDALEVRRQPYQELLDEAAAATRIGLRFVTPTCFRNGDLDSPLPEPRAMVHSWLARWSQYAPPDLRINVALVDVAWAHLAISGYELRTEVRDLGYGKQTGFVGRVSLVIIKPRKLGPEILKQLNALADYAEFCGTGRKTTQGMGQTRRVRREQ